jgi:hypothetical protein
MDAVRRLFNDRTNFHFQAIASNLTPANGAMTRLLTEVSQRYAAIPGSPHEWHAAALHQLWRLAYRKASTMADAFRAIMLPSSSPLSWFPLCPTSSPRRGRRRLRTEADEAKHADAIWKVRMPDRKVFSSASARSAARPLRLSLS